MNLQHEINKHGAENLLIYSYPHMDISWSGDRLKKLITEPWNDSDTVISDLQISIDRGLIKVYVDCAKIN